MAEVNTIKQYDTVKDKSGKRFRVTEIKSDGTGHVEATLKGINPDGSARRGMPRRVRLDVLEKNYTRVNLAPVEVKKIDDLRKEETKVTQVPTPSDKALEKLKESVRELSMDEVEDALTKSTVGDTVVPKDGKRMKDFEDSINILRTECLDLKAEKNKLLRELDELKKTISKMKYAHDEEVRALNDELMEMKILAKKGNEYSDRLADDEEVFRKMRALAKSINGMADSIMGLAYMINDETEGRI